MTPAIRPTVRMENSSTGRAPGVPADCTILRVMIPPVMHAAPAAPPAPMLQSACPTGSWPLTSGVHHPTHGVERGLGDCLGERRMRVDGEVDLLDRILVLARDHRELVNHLRRG